LFSPVCHFQKNGRNTFQMPLNGLQHRSRPRGTSRRRQSREAALHPLSHRSHCRLSTQNKSTQRAFSRTEGRSEGSCRRWRSSRSWVSQSRQSQRSFHPVREWFGVSPTTFGVQPCRSFSFNYHQRTIQSENADLNAKFTRKWTVCAADLALRAMTQ
jgi:hypothetical protein